MRWTSFILIHIRKAEKLIIYLNVSVIGYFAQIQTM